MGMLSKLFSKTKVIDNVLDKDTGLLTQLGGWVGNMNLTKEEIIEFNAKTVANVHTFVAASLSESTERSKTRRSIATMWIKSNLAIVFFACVSAPFDKELAQFYLDLATSALMVSVTTAISIFFFGSHGLAKWQESKKK